MPSPDQFATVIAGGLVYQYWQTVEVEREYGKTLDFARVAVAEIGSPTTGWITQRLAPGDPAQVMLGGRLVINGKVTIRQAAYDANKHAVEITVTSPVLSLTKATVSANPGRKREGNRLRSAGGAVPASLVLPPVASSKAVRLWIFVSQVCHAVRMSRQHSTDCSSRSVSIGER